MHKKSAELMEKISILPDTPGVYTYYDAEGTVIYVGKAKNLKRRVSSYFNRTHDCNRTNLLVRAIADMSYIVVPTEQDALDLENSMIKEYKPRYNVLLKDDKSYPWIVVTNELYPRVFLTRQLIKDGSKYFGPYANTGVAHTVIELIRELYPIRTCRLPITEDYLARGAGHLCLQYHIKRCRGCCTGAIDPDTYGEYIRNIKQILRGNTSELAEYLMGEMNRLAGELRFEEAQELKLKYQLLQNYRSRSVIVSQTIVDIDVFGIDDDGSADRDVYINYMHVRRGAVVRSVTLRYRRSLDESPAQLLAYAMDEIKRSLGVVYDEVVVPLAPEVEMPDVTFSIPRRGDKAKLLEVSVRNARQNRIDDLKHMEKRNPEERLERTLERMKADFRLSELPRHIECFDNSNIQGTNPVASCVVFRDGKPSRREYRHFNVKTVVGPDDYASMREVVYRRYSRLLAEGAELPDLIVADGGKGQMGAIHEVLEALGLEIPIAGLAKDDRHRTSELYCGYPPLLVGIRPASPVFQVLSHIQEEVHRFAIAFHRQKRSKAFIHSELEQIEGIGAKTAERLLAHFRSVARIKAAPDEELTQLVGAARARKIKEFFAR